jgi:hypothetical protein
MFWVVGFLVLLVALLIPILAIVLDAPALRNVFERRFGPPSSSEMETLNRKVTLLEDEVEDLSRAVQGLKDETQFLQRLLEDGEQRASQRLPPPS